jgi:hypothetical protein
VSSQHAPVVPADRYGAPAPWRRRVLLAGVTVVVGAFLGWLVWTVLVHAAPPVDSDLLSFDIVDEHTAVAVVHVELADDAADPSCLLRAYAEDHSVVGELSFVPETDDGARIEKTIRTERRATSVESVGCTAQGQSRPR